MKEKEAIERIDRVLSLAFNGDEPTLRLAKEDWKTIKRYINRLENECTKNKNRSEDGGW